MPRRRARRLVERGPVASSGPALRRGQVPAETGEAHQGGPQGRDLRVRRHDDVAAQQVRLGLHEQAGGGGAAVGVQDGQVAGPEGLDDVGDLMGDGLQGRACEVAPLGGCGQARDQADGPAVPPGGAQAREGRYEADAGGVGDGGRQLVERASGG